MKTLQKTQESRDRREILKSKVDSDADTKQDLFEFDFELRLSDGVVEEQKKPLHWTNTQVPIIIHHLKT